MDVGVSPVAAWRTDYPDSSGNAPTPWLQHDFATDPQAYMAAVLSTVRAHFRADGNRLVGTGAEPWWISEWMDYDLPGREPLMGLTKERGPRNGDLSPVSIRGPQVWAVGFYNQSGAVTFGEIFADPCQPSVPEKVLFAEGAAAIKFLFSDANLGKFAGQVPYLDGAPIYDAHIDPEGVSGAAPIQNRSNRKVQLLQLDIAIKDDRATKTGWVFGTFAWVGPKTGDGLFDNLVPVSLAWANDAGATTDNITESWINASLEGKLFGWAARPHLGFLGRANGPADNIRSSCLSCHAAARTPRSDRGLLGSGFNLSDLNNPAKVKAHVDVWFQNIMAGEVFDPTNPPAVAALDYSLQLEAAIDRACLACKDGAFDGPTPPICKAAGFHTEPTCRQLSLMSVVISQENRADRPLPRQ